MKSQQVFFHGVSKKRCGIWDSWQVFFHRVSKKNQGGIIFSFFRVFAQERAKRHFLVSNVSVDMLTEICT